LNQHPSSALQTPRGESMKKRNINNKQIIEWKEYLLKEFKPALSHKPEHLSFPYSSIFQTSILFKIMDFINIDKNS
jgi:hypothetical protein